MSNAALIMHQHRHPDPDDWFVRPVVEAWYDQYIADGNDHRAFAIDGTRWRASWAGSCARQVAYNVAGVEVTNPVTVADAWRFNIGSMLHDHIQKVVLDRWPGSQIEVKVRVGDDGSGHADCLVVTDEGERVAVEIKSINGTGFKTSTIGKSKGALPDGARVSAILQGALCAASMDPPADKLVVAYFSLENISTFVAKNLPTETRRFAAQWTFTRDEFMVLAADEARRLDRIVTIVDKLGPANVPRIIPDPNLPPHRVADPATGLLHIIDPETGDFLRKDRTWMCDYCSHREQCIDDSQ
jgi:hypothetical protein